MFVPDYIDVNVDHMFDHFDVYFLSVMISLGIDPCRIIPSALYIVGLMWICHPVSAQRDKTHNCGGTRLSGSDLLF